MNDKKRRQRLFSALLFGLVLFLFVVGMALAAGNISNTNKWAWGTNAGWINFNPDNGGVTVYPDHLEGYAWGENVGWIRLGTYTGGGSHTYTNADQNTYGVNRDTGTGALSGYAWSTTAGWINFAPVPQSGTFTDGVKVDAAGNFTGYAWSENVGWIKFNGTAANSATYKVATAGPLAVTLAGFDAQQVDGHVLVAWETVSEIDNAGFTLYRGLLADGSDRTVLTSVPSQSPGASQGASYSHADATVAADRTYWYWLEDVDLSGATTLHGPVSATVQTPTAIGLAGFEAVPGGNRSVARLALAAGLAVIAGGWTVWRRRRRLLR